MITVEARLRQLRKAMAKAKLDALILPSNDPHQSEYVAEYWKVREYFSGFTGSAGILIVLADYAALWTDSRYFLQAEKELEGSGIVLHRLVEQTAPEHLHWLVDYLPEGSTIGGEAAMFSVHQVYYLQRLASTKSIEIKAAKNIIGNVWKKRPDMPGSIAYDFDIKYAGVSREDKLTRLRAFMKQRGVNFYFVSALHEIAWLLNIRAWDVDFTPVVLSYLLVGEKNATLFVKDYKIPNALKEKLKAAGIALKDYGSIVHGLGAISSHKVVYADKHDFSWKCQMSMHENIVLGESVITPWMAIKNPTEIQHFKDVMVKDGVALIKLYRWLEDTLGNRSVKETEVAIQLAKFRSEQEGYKGESFPAIVGYEANGAIVHYRAQEEDCASIEKRGMLLLDSGGQYINGTTDITRTVHFGEPTPEQRKHYTLVLKGNIGLQMVHFPKGITGAQLDTLARFPLWKEGLNYGHGTGHGVGFFLGVHEAPQGFAPNIKSSRGYTPIEENTVTSNEPGYYKPGTYGIRIENLMQCVPSDKNPDFLAFEVLTLFPIATNMIDNSLLNYAERVWLNRYHRKVYSALSPNLGEKDRAWLWNHCQAI
ncbi:MAG: aminopeptidase P family protein [Aureispira sp.]